MKALEKYSHVKPSLLKSSIIFLRILTCLSWPAPQKLVQVLPIGDPDAMS